MKSILKILLILIILGLGAYLYLTIQWGPYGKGGVVYLPKGSSVSKIAQNLTKAGVIRNPWSFKLLVRLEGVEKELQAGEYEFPPELSTRAVIAKIRRGERRTYKLIIPEGYNYSQIAQRIAKTGLATEAEVLAAFQDPKYLSLLDFPTPSLEGYVFPSTYVYDRGTTLDALLKQMIRNYKKSLGPDLIQRAQQAGWTLPQLTTLASIIEKETGQASERPLIASVFHNRLKIGMPLQSDPTIIYGLKNFDGNIRKKDIKEPHLYNTYVHVGLPPGPIASPGKESLRAVMYPAESDYLFFVSKGDGTHQFSKTLAEHNEAVRNFQLGKRSQKGSQKPSPESSQEKPKSSANRPIMKPIPNQ